MYRAIIFFSFVCSGSLLHSQSCLDGYHVFTRQGQIDSFSTYYPGCNVIEGTLKLYSSNIKNLKGLKIIKAITGRLTLQSTDLTTLEDLNLIEEINQLELIYNGKLQNLNGFHFDTINFLRISGGADTNLDALSVIKYVSILYLEYAPIHNLNALSSLEDYRYIELTDLPFLSSLEGLPKLSHVSQERKLKISGCPLLLRANGVENSGLDRIDFNSPVLYDVSAVGSIPGLKSLTLILCKAMSNISGLQDLDQFQSLTLVTNLNLERIEGPDSNTAMNTINFLNNPKLVTVTGFQNVNKVSNIKVKKTGLTNMSFLSSLDSVYSDFIIEENPSLQNLSGLEDLEFIKGTLSIRLNPNLQSLLNLSSLHQVGSDFHLQLNQKISSLQGLESLHRIGGSFLMQAQGLIQNFNGLQSLRTIGNELYISVNTNLSSPDGLNALDSIYGDMTFSSNQNLTNLDVLHDIRHIGGGFLLSSNPNLASIPFFEDLYSIRGDLTIFDNDKLQSLEGLHNLDDITGILKVSGNAILPTLDGLDNIRSYTISNLKIQGNPSLSTCITPAICRHLDQDRPSTISNNDDGCQSADEIYLSCGTVGINETLQGKISIYPNPTTGLVYFNSNEHLIQSIQIKNSDGRLIKEADPNTLIDMSSYPVGIYFAQIRVNDSIVVKKIVKTSFP